MKYVIVKEVVADSILEAVWNEGKGEIVAASKKDEDGSGADDITFPTLTL